MDKKDPLEWIIRFDFLLIATPRYPRVAPVFCPVPIRSTVGLLPWDCLPPSNTVVVVENGKSLLYRSFFWRLIFFFSFHRIISCFSKLKYYNTKITLVFENCHYRNDSKDKSIDPCFIYTHKFLFFYYFYLHSCKAIITFSFLRINLENNPREWGWPNDGGRRRMNQFEVWDLYDDRLRGGGRCFYLHHWRLNWTHEWRSPAAGSG